jgi:hypothetical protein
VSRVHIKSSGGYSKSAQCRKAWRNSICYDREQPMWVFEWTGDEFAPAIREASIVYQHLHRYVYAAELVCGKRVIDAAADGYGTGILAEAAASVVGMVRDETIAGHASARYGKPNLQFIHGTIGDLTTTHEGEFDAAVFFTDPGLTTDYDPLLHDLKRFLNHDGLLIISVPARQESAEQYSPIQGELAREEFHQLLRTHFSNVWIFGQNTYANSSIWPTASAGRNCREFVLARDRADGFEIIDPNKRVARWLIGIASDSPTISEPNASVFIDNGNELFRDQQQATQQLIDSKAHDAETLKNYESQLAERRESLAALKEALAWHQSQIRSLTKTREYLESEVAHFRRAVASNKEALAWRAKQVEELERGAEQLRARIREIESSLHRMTLSPEWRLATSLRSIRKRLFADRGLVYRLYIRIIGSGKALNGK